MNENVWPLILLGGGLLAFLLVVSFLSKNYSLNNFKSNPEMFAQYHRDIDAFYQHVLEKNA